MEEIEFRKANGSWTEDLFIAKSTSIPEIIEEESKQITTVVIFVISAVLAITLLFVIAIFLDCRQQRLQRFQEVSKRKLVRLKLPVPKVFIRRNAEDKRTITDDMEGSEEPGPSSSSVIV